MKVTFGSKKIEKYFTNPKYMKKEFGKLENMATQRFLDFLSFENLQALIDSGLGKCHSLTGDRIGLYAVFLSRNYRILFEINHSEIPRRPDGSIDYKNVTKIKIVNHKEDYH